MKRSDPRILFCIAVLALALTVALVWSGGGDELNASLVPAVSASVPCAESAALGSPEDGEIPPSPLVDIPDDGAERQLFEKLQDALEDAFSRLSAKNVYDSVTGKTVDLSWQKALRVFDI